MNAGGGTSIPQRHPPLGAHRTAAAVVTRLLEFNSDGGELRQLALDIADAFGDAPSGREQFYAYLLVTRHPRLLAAVPPRGTDAQLGALLALAPIVGASLWLLDDERGLVCTNAHDEKATLRRMRQLACALLASPKSQARDRTGLLAVPVRPWGTVHGALVVRPQPRFGRTAWPYASECASSLSLVLERQLLLERSKLERRLLESVEQRVTTLLHDLHDGPLQHVSIERAELAQARRTLEVLAETNGEGGAHLALVRRIGDVEELARTVEQELRDVIMSVPTVPAASRLGSALQRELRLFKRFTGLDVRLRVRGDEGRPTLPQRVALVSILREALNNVRKHSGATDVRVSVCWTPARIVLRVTDNGRGFKLDRQAEIGARGLGLAGMVERAEQVQGAVRVQSRSGGPTTVRAVIPR